MPSNDNVIRMHPAVFTHKSKDWAPAVADSGTVALAGATLTVEDERRRALDSNRRPSGASWAGVLPGWLGLLAGCLFLWWVW